MIVVERLLTDAARERDWQLAAGIDITKQHVGNRVAPLSAGEPGLQNRRRVLGNPVDRQRAAVHEYDNHRLAGRT